MSAEKYRHISYEPDYNLTDKYIEILESDLARRIGHEMNMPQDLYSLWVKPDSIYANIARTNEKKYWKYMPDIMSIHEDQSMFLLLFDTRMARNEVVHSTRISGFTPDGMRDDNDRTGLIIIDDIIDSNQGLTAKYFRDYYTERGIDLMKCITVESNIKIHNTRKKDGINVPDLAYLSLFKNVVNRGGQAGDSCVFAVINMPTVLSFGRIGLDYEPLAGMKSLQTPADNGEFDDNFMPVCIPHDAKSHELFKNIEPFALTEIYLEDN